MFKCDDCNKVFDEPIRVVFDNHPELGGYNEYKSGCPYCNSPHIDNAFTCARCGEVFSFSEVCFEGDQVFCEACLTEIEDDGESEPCNVFEELNNIFNNALRIGDMYG